MTNYQVAKINPDDPGKVYESVIPDTISRAADLTTHASDTTSVHGIADTSVLATDTDVSDAVSDLAEIVGVDRELTSSPYLLSILNDPIFTQSSSNVGGCSFSTDGNYLYVTSYGASDGALIVVDVSDPEAPFVVGTTGSLASLARASSVATLSATHVAVSRNTGNSVVVVNVSTPTAPSVVGTTNTAVNAVHIATTGNYAVVGGFTTDALSIVDCSTAASPAQVGRVTDATNLATVRTVLVNDAGTQAVCLAANRLTVVDITTKTAPTVLGSLLDATNLGNGYGAHWDEDNDLVLVTNSTKLTVVDVSNPASPVLLGTPTTLTGGATASDVELVDDVALCFGKRLSRVNLATPASPVQLEQAFSDNDFNHPAWPSVPTERTARSGDVIAALSNTSRNLRLFGPFTGQGGSHVIIGDSITNQNGSGTGGGSNRGWFHWSNTILGQSLALARNAGIDSDTTTEVLARLYGDCLIYRPRSVTLLIGTNDIVTGGLSTQQLIAGIKKICGRITAAGATVVLCTLLPRTGLTTAQRLSFDQVNNWIRAYATSARRMVLCDWAAALADPTTGDPASNVLADGKHPSSLGAYLMGVEHATVLDRAGLGGKIKRPGFSTSGNLLTNGSFSGTGGTGSGVVADSWTAAGGGSFTGSKVSASTGDTRGGWQQIVLSSGTVTLSPTAAVSVPASGDGSGKSTVVGFVEVDVDSGASFTAFGLSLADGSGTAYCLKPDSSVAVPVSGRFVLQTMPLVVANSASTLTWTLTVTGAGTFRVRTAALVGADRT